jgi:hypothetical protein
MKKYIIKLNIALMAAGLLWLNACDLDINEDPNRATGAVVTPNLMLPDIAQYLATTQISTGSFANFTIGYYVPGDGISGYGDIFSYNYTAAYNTDSWNRPFADLRGLNTIIATAEENPIYAAYGAIAHVLKTYEYQLLVDSYGDVPYTEAGLGGEGNYTPKFEKDSEVYKLLVAELDGAISTLKANIGVVGLAPLGNVDAFFGGDLNKWIKFANNIKLRLLIRANGSSIDAFVQSAFNTFSSDGFLKENVLVNPGYNSNNQQNPLWTAHHSSVSGTVTSTGRYYVPTQYVYAFYDGRKILDEVRGKLTYRLYPNTPVWHLGDEVGRPASPTYIWHAGTGSGTSASTAAGILKSRAAAAPFFLVAETYFLLAEAALKGHALDGDAESNFRKGVEAAFSYLAIEGTATAPPASFNTAQVVDAYIAANEDSYLVNFSKAATTEQKLEAIITQKYILFNLINPFEAWTEFRRTTYPKIVGTDPWTTFVSMQTTSTRPDRLPIRLLYPQAELNLNGANVPKIPNAFSNPIFWQNN